MPDEAMNEVTRREWRELGFFYDRDDEKKTWILIGSRNGLLKFRKLLLDYVGNPRNAQQSEHEHFGPYMYLEIMTWPTPGFDEHAVRGPLPDLARLAELIGTRISQAGPGTILRIQQEFAADSPYALALDIREEGFDPAIADPLLAGRAG